MITPISAATEGLIDDRSPLSIASRGLIKLPVEVSQVIIVRKHGRFKTPAIDMPFPWDEPIRVKMEKRELPGADIHKDDEEVLRILVEIITGGYLN